MTPKPHQERAALTDMQVIELGIRSRNGPSWNWMCSLVGLESMVAFCREFHRIALASQAAPEQPEQPDSSHQAQPSGEAATVAMTGRPPEMLQDCDRKFSMALSNTPHARLNAREAAAQHNADNAVRPTDEKESCVPAVSALPQQELVYLRHEAKKAAVAMALHMPNRKETHDLFAALTGEATPPPDGLRLLPVEPTPEMVWAGNSLIRYDLDLNGLQTSAAGVWRAMVAALNPPAPRAADNDSPMSDKKDSALPPPPVEGEQQ